METLAELKAREQEVEREWPWLHDALNEVARARAEHEMGERPIKAAAAATAYAVSARSRL